MGTQTTLRPTEKSIPLEGSVEGPQRGQYPHEVLWGGGQGQDRDTSGTYLADGHLILIQAVTQELQLSLSLPQLILQLPHQHGLLAGQG